MDTWYFSLSTGTDPNIESLPTGNKKKEIVFQQS
jgi:hypothetical protein